MAAILNADSALTDHANNNLGINIKGFEAGSKVRVEVEQCQVECAVTSRFQDCSKLSVER